MTSEIKFIGGKYYALLNNVYLGKSTHKEGAENLISSCLNALENDNRIKYLEKRIRKIRNNVFNYENAGRNLEKVKGEILIRRKRHQFINLEKLKRAINN